VRGRSPWAQFALATVLSALLVLWVSPPRPEARITSLGAVLVGTVSGVGLYGAVARRRPFLPSLLPGVGAKCSILALAAVNEEILWRRVVLGELLHSGAPAALAGSSLAFGLAHRARPGLQLATGLAFGALYLATGALGACIAAHLTYNLCLLALRDRAGLGRELAS
jgi:membrane protease YdiL (CAAX protease family)